MAYLGGVMQEQVNTPLFSPYSYVSVGGEACPLTAPRPFYLCFPKFLAPSLIIVTFFSKKILFIFSK